MIDRTIHAFFAFMWFNAAVVFAKEGMRWLGLGAFASLALLAWRCQRNQAHAAVSESN